MELPLPAQAGLTGLILLVPKSGPLLLLLLLVRPEEQAVKRAVVRQALAPQGITVERVHRHPRYMTAAVVVALAIPLRLDNRAQRQQRETAAQEGTAVPLVKPPVKAAGRERRVLHLLSLR